MQRLRSKIHMKSSIPNLTCKMSELVAEGDLKPLPAALPSTKKNPTDFLKQVKRL